MHARPRRQPGGVVLRGSAARVHFGAQARHRQGGPGERLEAGRQDSQSHAATKSHAEHERVAEGGQHVRQGGEESTSNGSALRLGESSNDLSVKLCCWLLVHACGFLINLFVFITDQDI